MASKGLGRGLESLIPRNVPVVPVYKEEPAVVPTSVSLTKIRQSRYQPRVHFKEETLKELADSIREQGLIQPLIVTPVQESGSNGGAEYELIAGERRWRAAQMAGLDTVPIVIKKVSEKEQFQISLIENIQREDLNPIEEAAAYKRLMEEFQLTQEELSKTLGKGRSVIANTLRLLQLPQALQDAVANGTISAGHARSLASIDDFNLQKEISDRILNERLTVRDVEKIVSDWKGALSSGQVITSARKEPEVRELENSLQQILGTKVQIQSSGKGASLRGTVKIFYYSLDDLERVIALLKK